MGSRILLAVLDYGIKRQWVSCPENDIGYATKLAVNLLFVLAGYRLLSRRGYGISTTPWKAKNTQARMR